MKNVSRKQYDWKRETDGELRHESSHGESRPPREYGGRYSLSYYSLSHLPRSAFILEYEYAVQSVITALDHSPDAAAMHFSFTGQCANIPWHILIFLC